MRKIIGKKAYDTDKLIEIARVTSGNHGDFDWLEERLYYVNAYKYMIYGNGGARTRYAQRTDGNSWCGGSDMCIITRDEAIDWCERNDIGTDKVISELHIERCVVGRKK